MIIDLKDITTYYINLKEHTTKNHKVKSLLRELNFKNVIRLEGYHYPSNPIAGCSRAHFHSLDKTNPPFILLEDDVFIFKERWNNGIIEVPDDADAVYLGTSTWGRMNGHNGEFIQYDVIDEFPGILRIYNMLATHAILYFSEEYVSMIKRVAYHTGYIIEDYNDVGFAEVQRYFKVYALNEPMFAQSSNIIGTNKPITSLDHKECMCFVHPQFFPYKIK
jgi:uncharacterized protein YfaT (DUF1175 family)